MGDVIVRGLLRAIDARFVVGRFTESTREAVLRHGLSGPRARLLGEALAGCALMGSILKPGEKLSLQVRADGALRSLIADFDDEANVRGAISADEGASYGQLAGSPGTLVVSRSTRRGVSQQGVSPLALGDLPADMALYCSVSEQIESYLDVVFGEDDFPEVGGLLLQALPDADLEVFDRLRRQFEEGQIKPDVELARSPAGYLMHMLREYDPQMLLEKPLQYHCSCTEGRVKAVLRSLGNEELQDMVQKDHGAEVTCQWCGQRYNISEEELIALMSNFSRN